MHSDSESDARGARQPNPSGAKGDPHDAGLLLDLLTRHREKFRRINPDSTETRTLRFLVEERRKLVNERIRFSQRLNSHLKLYFPQVLNWFCDMSSQIAEHFLERWPTLEAVQKAKAKTLERFFADHNSRSPERIKTRLDEIREAVTATHDSAVIIASSSAALALVKILRELRNAISSYDSQIEKLAQAHPDFIIFDSFPGAGVAMAPRLIAAFGTCRDRYRTAHEIHCYVAPIHERSGAETSGRTNDSEPSAAFRCFRRLGRCRCIQWPPQPGRKTTISSNVPKANPITRLFEP